MATELDTLIAVLREAEAVEECQNGLETALAHMGFPYLIYIGVDLPLHGGTQPVVMTNLPQGWREAYIAAKAYQVDPLLAQAYDSVVPVYWQGLAVNGHMPEDVARLMRQASEVGFRNGVTFPVHGPAARFGAFIVGASDPVARTSTKWPEAEARLCLLALSLHDAAVRTKSLAGDGEALVLTKREAECLHWAAQGKTSWETAKILDVAEVTVNFHLKNVMKKLGVANRVQAVARAVQMQLIVP